MIRGRFLCGALFFGLALSTAVAVDFDLDLPKTVPDTPFDIQAARMEYTSNGTMIASGGVTGRFENAVLYADKVTGNPDTGDLHAEGNIQFERGKVLWQGSELDYNYLTQAGVFGPSALYFDPMFMSVDHVERVSTNEFLLQDATFTTCPKHPPHIHVHAKEARLINENLIKAKGVTFYIGKVPVLYVPRWSHRLRTSVFTFKLGAGSEWGPYALTRTTLPITEDIDSLTDINLYGKRGIGVGQGFAWHADKATGEIHAFYINDRSPHERFDSPEISENRYRFKLEHLQNFSDTHYINTKWNYLSDPAIVEEFFKEEYRNNAQPENYGSWVYGNRFLGSEAFVSKRLNDFYDNLDQAQYSADLYRTRIGNSPFYFQSENAVAYLDRVYSETNGAAFSDPYDSSRIDSANTLFLPQRLGFLSLVPRVGYRATYYSKTPDSSDDRYRQIPGAGVEASFQATKILSERERWYGKGLRHKIEPYADYIYENSSVETNDLLQFDDVDRLSDQNKLKLGLRNVLQTRRDEHVSRFIDLDLYTYYLVDRNGAEHEFDNLYIDARMPLTRHTMLDMKGVYDWYGADFPLFDTRFSYHTDDYIVSIEHFYQQHERSLWTPRAILFPGKNVSLEAYVRYDNKSNDLQEASVIVYKNFCCMRYGLGYHTYDDGEQSVMFSVGLSAFPEVGAGSGL